MYTVCILMELVWNDSRLWRVCIEYIEYVLYNTLCVDREVLHAYVCILTTLVWHDSTTREAEYQVELSYIYYIYIYTWEYRIYSLYTLYVWTERFCMHAVCILMALVWHDSTTCEAEYNTHIHKYQSETIDLRNVSWTRQLSVVAFIFVCSRARMNIRSILCINTCEKTYVWISGLDCYKNCFTNTTSQCCGLIIFVFTCENEYQVDTMYN